MINVTTKIDKNVLTIKINLDEIHGQSVSRKTNIVASTGGFVPLDYAHPEGKVLALNLNVCAK